MPISTAYHYAPRRKSSLSHVTTEDLLQEHDRPKKCYRCDVKSRKVSHCIRRPSRCTSLLGSMQESLLRGSTSGSQSKPVKFGAVISSGLGVPVKLDFDATFYTWSDGSESPYVGSIKVGEREKKSGFPGLKIKERGQIQIVICNSEESPIKVIVANYNIRKLKSGYRVFIRQSNEDYTIHLNFINSHGKFYLFEDLKVIFNNHINVENSTEDRLVGKPSKVDLGYYLNKCLYCDEEVDDDSSWEDVNSLTSRVSSLDMIKDDDENINDDPPDGIEFKFKKDYQIKFIDDDKSELKTIGEQIIPPKTPSGNVHNKKRNLSGFAQYDNNNDDDDDDEDSGLLVMRTRTVNLK